MNVLRSIAYSALPIVALAVVIAILAAVVGAAERTP